VKTLEEEEGEVLSGRCERRWSDGCALYCVALYGITLHRLPYTVLHYTVLHCNVLYCTALCVLYSTILHCTMLGCTVLPYCTVLLSRTPYLHLLCEISVESSQ
jgi:hypothetical protein